MVFPTPWWGQLRAPYCRCRSWVYGKPVVCIYWMLSFPCLPCPLYTNSNRSPTNCTVSLHKSPIFPSTKPDKTCKVKLSTVPERSVLRSGNRIRGRPGGDFQRRNETEEQTQNPDPAKSNSKWKRQLMAITKATKHETYKLSELELSP